MILRIRKGRITCLFDISMLQIWCCHRLLGLVILNSRMISPICIGDIPKVIFLIYKGDATNFDFLHIILLKFIITCNFQ